MVGLQILKHTYGLSDEQVVSQYKAPHISNIFVEVIILKINYQLLQ